MKNFKNLALVSFVTILVGGCTANGKAVVDARPAKADAADVFDRTPDKAPFVIIPGKYEIRIDTAFDDAKSSSLTPLIQHGFEVLIYENYSGGRYDMVHNGYRIEISEGQFEYAYVPVIQGSCSSLAYAFEISGSFISPTEARGRFVYYRDCQPANAGHFIATLVTDDKADAGVSDTARPGPEAGPETLPDVKDAFMPDLPCINPAPGHYSVKLDPALFKAGDSLSRLGSYGFTVSVDKNGLYRIDATYDGWAHYKFIVACGFIDAKHGQGYDGYGGTNCPTDGFGLVGLFTSPTEAVGQYKSMQRCQVRSAGYFIAALDPAPDSAVAPDIIALTDAGAVIDAGSIDR